MAGAQWDLITVGGGLAGAALARAMAQHGARVLIVERERAFGDRVRGEVLVTWGAAEAQALGLGDVLSAHPLPRSCLYLGGVPVLHRELVDTTPQRLPWLAFYHPAMQERGLAAAAAAGADVWRGARVHAVEPGAPPRVTIARDGRREEVTARLVAGVDGRGSAVRSWAGFAVRHDPEHIHFSGVLVDDVPAAADTSHFFLNPSLGRIALVFPQGGDRVRAYVGYHKDTDPPRGGANTFARFVEESERAGAEPTLYARARAAGPLAIFPGADSWVEHPYRDGVALLGDAAATSDPTWGQGMSLALRDVRALATALAAADDWDVAGHAYATAHDAHYGVIHAVERWWADLFMEVGPAADERRERALPKLALDPTRLADAIVGGPELGADEATRRRFFGED